MDIGTISLLCFLGFLVFLPVYGYVCHLKSEEKVKNGADKRKLQNILASVVPAGEHYTVAYAYWFQLDRPKWGRSYTTTYWYYAIGFNEERIYVVPLRFEDGEIYYKDSVCIEKAIVGKVESDVLAGKIRLFDKKGQEIVHLQVEAKNNSSHGNGDINLAQEAEAKAFKEWIARWTSEINQTVTNSPNGKVSTEAKTSQTGDIFLSVNDIERCLLQQTTSYQRGTPVITATNKENELFLIYYYTNTFYIVKVAYENSKLNVKYDYRRKHMGLEGFQYRMTENGVTALLKLVNVQVEFMIQPKVDYQGCGCNVVADQTSLYKQFVSYLDTYRENINSFAASARKENGYMELLQCVRKIKDADKKDICKSLDDGNVVEAIRQIQTHTGLGLADCKKIAENPYMYL